MTGYQPARPGSHWIDYPDTTYGTVGSAEFSHWDDALTALKTGNCRRVEDYVGTYGLTSAAVNAAIADAVADGGKPVILPFCTSSSPLTVTASINLKTNVSLLGPGVGACHLKVQSGLTAPALLGSSGNTVTDCELAGFTIDGDYSTSALSLNCIQITSGLRPKIHDLKIANFGQIGVLMQTGTSEALVERCEIRTTGGAGGANGFGILFKASSQCKARGNWIYDAQGMSIGGNAAATGCEVSGNYLDKTNVTAYETIGYTSDCTGWVVVGNHCVNSKDNGISTSGGGVVTGNWIDSPSHNGVDISASHTVCANNYIRNAGQAGAGLGYAGYVTEGVSNCVITGGSVFDDQGASATCDWGVKENVTAGGNRYGPIRITGVRLGSYSLRPDTTSFVVRNEPPAIQTYGTTIGVQVPGSEVHRVAATDGVAFKLVNPTNSYPGATLLYDVVNSSGGAHGTITADTAFSLAGGGTTIWAAATIANTKGRMIAFYCTAAGGATNTWREMWRSSGDT